MISLKVFGCGLYEEWRIEIFAPIRPHVNGKGKKKKFSFQHFKNPQRNFVRTVEKKFQEKFENFWLSFVRGVAF